MRWLWLVVLAGCGLWEVPEVSEVPPIDTVAVQVVRFDTGGLVSTGVPLAPGLLRDADSVRLMIDGAEVPMYVEPLAGRHADGSYRSVLVQFPWTGDSARGVLEFGVAGVRQGTKTPITLESVVVLPTSSAYLRSTQVLPPTIASAALLVTPLHTRFDELYRQASAMHVIRDNLDATDNLGSRRLNFYDRVLTSSAQWIRTGEVQYWRDATRLVRQYTAIAKDRNAGSAYAPWDFHPDGLFSSYLLTGDENSRRILAEFAQANSRNLFMASRNYTFNAYREGRGQQRVMLAALYAALLEDTSRDWYAVTDEYVTSWLDTQEPWHTQGSDGAWYYPITAGHNGQSNFMEGLRVSALVSYLELRHPSDAVRERVERAIRRQVDFLWNTQWQPQFQSFLYWSTDSAGKRSLADLNNLMALGFAYVYYVTGDEAYRDRAVQVMSPAFVPQADRWSVCWGCSNGKQFNQNYYSAFRALYYLNVPPRLEP